MIIMTSTSCSRLAAVIISSLVPIVSSAYHRMAPAEITLDTMALGYVLESPFSAIAEPVDLYCFDSYSYNWERSTEDNFRSNDVVFYGHFTSARQHLDYEYHSHYSSSRQLFQDSMIESLLLNDNVTEDDNSCEQWIIFSAGVMGAGKTHTINELTSNEQESFVTEIRHPFVYVDPDEIRRLLPEFHIYVDKDPEKAGENTRKEAGMLAELLTEAALERGQNVLVDGSLRDAEWYESYFTTLRYAYPRLKLGIIHVTAPAEDIIERVKHRAKLTGRAVPRDVLLESMERVPKSVDVLRHHVDFFMEINNAAGHTISVSSAEGTL